MPPTNTELLRRAEIFGNLSDQELAGIAQLMEERRYSEDQVLFRQGDPGDALLIVLEGRVKVYLQDGQREIVLAFFNSGDVLGEMALLTGEPRSANAVALSNTLVLALSKESFAAHLATNAGAMREMVRIMALRQFQMSQRLSHAPQESAEVAETGGRVYAVFSPRGGAGKTTVAVNLAASLARMVPGQVGLLDLALTFSHCALALNLSPKSTLASISEEFLSNMDAEELSFFLVGHSSSLKVLVAAGKPEEGESVTADVVRVALQGMRRLFPITVVDTDATFSEATIAALDAADKVLVLCAPELATVKDIRECQRVFAEVIHLPADRLLYVMNQTVPFSPLTPEQFSAAVEQKMWAEIPFGNDLPAMASARGEAFTHLYPESNVAKAIESIAHKLDGASSPEGIQPVARRATAGPRQPLARAASRGRSLEYAAFSKRLAAAVVDTIVAGIAASSAGSVVTGLGLLLTGDALLPVGMVFGAIAMWLYFALFESSGRQATPGKQMLGVVVTDLAGQRISFARATGRFGAKIVSTLPLYAGFLMAAFTAKKQALHDIIGGTFVLNGR